MNRKQIDVLEHVYEEVLGGLLQRQQRSALKPKVDSKMLSHLLDQALERQLPDEEVARLLVLADLPQRHCSRTVAMRLLDSSSWIEALASSTSSLSAQLEPMKNFLIFCIKTLRLKLFLF